MIDIIIPTNKSIDQVQKQINEIKKFTFIDEIEKYNFEDYRIIPTCQEGSAAYNRNYGLKASKNEIVIQMDDDIFGFYNGWLSDLIHPLLEVKNCIVSARFLKENCELQIMMSWGRSLHTRGLIEPPTELPSSCIAFRRELANKIIICDELPYNNPFDENYLKAEFDDTDFMMAAKYVDPSLKFYVNNDCKLIHLNAESWRDESIRGVNKSYFNKKWKQNR